MLHGYREILVKKIKVLKSLLIVYLFYPLHKCLLSYIIG